MRRIPVKQAATVRDRAIATVTSATRAVILPRIGCRTIVGRLTQIDVPAPVVRSVRVSGHA